MTESQDAKPPESQANDDYIATTIPVRIDIDMKQTVLSLEEAEAILRNATSLALGPCACRKTEQNCDGPIDVCLSLNHEEGEQYQGFKPVSVERALEALRMSHEAGLVHLAYRKPGQPISEFCSCCSCCCWLLKKLKAADYHEQIVEARLIAKQDPGKCIGCGACVDRCPFAAWLPSGSDVKPSLQANRCFGCGVCVTSCPSDAIALVPRAGAHGAV